MSRYRFRWIGLRAAVLVSTIVLLAGAVWGVETFLSRTPGPWFEAIQIVVTLTLILVTAVYVRATYALVEAQRWTVRRQGQEGVMRRLLEVVSLGHTRLSFLSQGFPIVETENRPDVPALVQRLDTSWLEKLADDVEALGYQANPIIEVRALTFCLRLAKMGLAVKALEMVIAHESQRSRQSSSAWSWSEARAWYESDVRPRDPVGRRVEWEDMLAGSRVMSTLKAIDDLKQEATDYLREGDQLHEILKRAREREEATSARR
jgi:hypothetical protein